MHRPSIVVGDSRTGYTSTYHGFYAPLQIGAQFAKEYGFSDQVGDWFRQQLGVQASDQKNFVPVDWVAESIVEMATGNLPSGTILHWTNPRPISCDEMQRAIMDSIGTYSQERTRMPNTESELPTPKLFKEQLSVYETYFGNDPYFDTTNAASFCPQIPCPAVDYASLRTTAEFALREQFGWPRKPLAELPHARLRDMLTNKGEIRTAEASSRLLEVRTLGPGAVETLVFARLEDGWTVGCKSAASGNVRLIISMNSLSDCIFGTTAIEDLIAQGQAAIVGSPTKDWPQLVADWLIDVKSNSQSE